MLPRCPPPAAADPGYPDLRTLAQERGSPPAVVLLGAAIALAAGGVGACAPSRTAGAPVPPVTGTMVVPREPAAAPATPLAGEVMAPTAPTGLTPLRDEPPARPAGALAGRRR